MRVAEVESADIRSRFYATLVLVIEPIDVQWLVASAALPSQAIDLYSGTKYYGRVTKKQRDFQEYPAQSVYQGERFCAGSGAFVFLVDTRQRRGRGQSVGRAQTTLPQLLSFSRVKFFFLVLVVLLILVARDLARSK